MLLNDKHLNIVCFDIPFPADYGGVIDVFYRIKALSQIGIKINLHCFEYGRKLDQRLESLCHRVYTYKRKTSLIQHFSRTPYIVKSRDNEALIHNLTQNDFPILFEGLHTCYFLNDVRLRNRYKMVRMHNIEHRYYAQLAKSENNWLKRSYFKLESSKLKHYQSVLKNANKVLAISEFEHNYFLLEGFKSEYLPAFTEDIKCFDNADLEDYAIYHGNLEVAENSRAAMFLVDVFRDTKHRLIIAGRNPNSQLKKNVHDCSNIQIVANPKEEALQKLLEHAGLQCLPTFQLTGVKLKLIKSLTMPSHVIANSFMVEGTGLSDYCIVAETKQEWKNQIDQWMGKDLTIEDYRERIVGLGKIHNNIKNAKRLVEWLA